MNRKIVKYVTAAADDLKSLDQEVNKLIAKGFQPYGSPYISDHKVSEFAEDFIAAQAMVKYE